MKKQNDSSQYAPPVDMEEIDKKMFAAMGAEKENMKKLPKKYNIEAGQYVVEPKSDE